MNLGRVIGCLWATQKVPDLAGVPLKWVQPLDFDRRPRGEPVVAVDAVGAGEDELVITVGSREATIPFPAQYLPVDLAIVGIVDRVDLQGEDPWRKGYDD